MQAPEGAPPSWGASAVLISGITVIVSGGNYAFSLAVLHLLPAQQYTAFASAQSLLLVIGSGVMAAIPWAMARYMALSGATRTARREAMHFGLSAASIQAVVAAIITAAVILPSGGGAPALVAALAAALVSMVVVPIGFLQGIRRVPAIGYLRLIELIVRVGTAITLVVLVQKSSAIALAGFPAGSAVLLALGLWVCRSGLPARRGDREVEWSLVRQSASLGTIQLLLSMLGALDTVAAPLSGLGSNHAASYQAAALLGRVPLFISAALGTVAYTHIVTSKDDAGVRREMSQVIYMYVLVAIPFAAVCWTLPDPLLRLLIPARFGTAPTLLKFAVTSGLAVGWIDIVSTAHQARGRFRQATTILVIAAVAQPVALITFGRALGLWWFAGALVAVSLTAAICLTVDGRAWLRLRLPPLHWAAIILGVGGLWALHGTPAAWLGLAITAGAGTLWLLVLRARTGRAPTGHVAEGSI